MKGITGRWVKNTLGITFFIVLSVVIISFLVVRSSYYNGAEQTLTTEAETMRTYISTMADYYGDFSSVARVAAEDFDKANIARLEILGSSGKTILSSAGFVSDSVSPIDYDLALLNQNGIGTWKGRLNETSERVMAVTALIYGENGQVVGGVRLVSSLSKIDIVLVGFGALFLLLGVIVMSFVIMSGSYFINTIVNPVNEITGTAKKIAAGDYAIRIEKKYDDEIGDLCDAINDLAGGLTEADRVKNDFISTVSHELRTPLTAIRGWGETIINASDDKVLTEKGLSVIVSETERLGKMVEELLDFSRLQSGRLTMRLGSCDVAAELEEAVLTYAPGAKKEEKSLNILPYGDESVIITADPDRIRQVFINIIDNAVKYTDRGGEINVSLQKGDGFVTVTVEDNGIGISDTDMPHIGEKFYKANFTRRGSGIGLATCDEIVRLHNGIMSIESKEGFGTRVSVALPTNQLSKQQDGNP